MNRRGVLYDPESWDRRPAPTLACLAVAARAAEALRRHRAGASDRVVLSVATEATFFLRGIIPGRTSGARTRNPAPAIRAERHVEPLAEFLAAAARTARAEFGGPLTS
jgi:hypothetical protein